VAFGGLVCLEGEVTNAEREDGGDVFEVLFVVINIIYYITFFVSRCFI
jgi:hypothetical protein